MAEAATPSAAAISNADSSMAPNKDKSTPVVRPERPDEDAYKKELAQAEKELRSAEERLVSISSSRRCGVVCR